MESRKWIAFLILLSLGLVGCGSDSEDTPDGGGGGGVDPDPTLLVISPSVETMDINSTLTFTATGGTPPYTFSVIDGQGTIDADTGEFFSASTAGAVVVQVRDFAGEIVQAFVDVVDNDSGCTVDCDGGSGGSDLQIDVSDTEIGVGQNIQLAATGGVPPYRFTLQAGEGYVWNNRYYALSRASSGVVQVEDANGNTSWTTIQVEAVGTLEISPKSGTITANDTVIFSTDGGRFPFTYSVVYGDASFNDDGSMMTAGSRPGIVRVRVTDRDGRSAYATMTVTAHPDQDRMEASASIKTEDRIGLTWDNVSSGEPLLHFHSMNGSSIKKTNINNGINCTSGNVVGAPCTAQIVMENFNNNASFPGVYKATVTMIGRVHTASVEICVRPSNKNVAYVKVNESAQTLSGTFKFDKSSERYFPEVTLSSLYFYVDNGNSKEGDVEISVEDAGYRNETSCGSGFYRSIRAY